MGLLASARSTAASPPRREPSRPPSLPLAARPPAEVVVKETHERSAVLCPVVGHAVCYEGDCSYWGGADGCIHPSRCPEADR